MRMRKQNCFYLKAVGVDIIEEFSFFLACIATGVKNNGILAIGNYKSVLLKGVKAKCLNMYWHEPKLRQICFSAAN